MKKILALVLAIGMMLGASCALAVPSDLQAEWGTENEIIGSGGLADALEAARDNESITYIRLRMSLSEQSVYWINTPGELTIDLDGQQIQSNSTAFEIQSGKVKFKDSKGGASVKAISDALRVLKDAEAVIESGSFVGDYYAVINSGTLEIAGGSFESDYYAVSNDGKLTIADGSFVGADSAVHNDGTLDITGGRFVCRNEDGIGPVFLQSADGSKTTIGGEASFELGEDADGWSDLCLLELQAGTFDLSGCGDLSGWKIHTVWQDITDALKLPKGNFLTVDGEIPEDFKKFNTYWISRPVKVTFDWNGGKGAETEKTAFTEAVIDLPMSSTEEPKGMTLAGWSEKRDGSGELYKKKYQVSGDVTLYAQWKEKTADLLVGGKPLSEGEYIDNNGVVSTSKPAGGYAHVKDGVLILNNYRYEGDGGVLDENQGGICARGKLNIELIGENRLTVTDDAIYVMESNTAAGDLTIGGSGTLHIWANSDGMRADNISIRGGTIVMEAESDGIDPTESVHIYGGTVMIVAGDNGFEPTDNIEIYGGTVVIDAADRGLKAGKCIKISGGDVTIDAFNEAVYLDSYSSDDGGVEISGGKLTARTENGFSALMAGGAEITFDGVELTVPEDGYLDAFEYEYEYGWYAIMDAQGDPAKLVAIGRKPAELERIPAKGENTVKVPVNMVGSKAVVHIDEQAIAEAMGDANVLTIDLSGVKAENPELVFQPQAVQAIGEAIDSKDKCLEVKLPGGRRAMFDGGVMRTLTTAEDDVQLNFTLRDAKGIDLNSAQAAAVGKRPAYYLQWMKEGMPVSNLGGKATLTVPYTLNKGESADKLAVFYVAEDGAKEACRSAYDETAKEMQWSTNHFSVYMIDHVEAKLPATGDASMLGAWVALLGAAGAGLKLRRKK